MGVAMPISAPHRSRNPHSRNILSMLALGRTYVRHVPGTVGKASLAGRWLDLRLRDSPRRTVATTVDGARMVVDTRDVIQRWIYLFGVWEPHLTAWLRHRLAPGDTFIDVGANIGYYSLLASRLVGPDGTVVAIDASRAFTEQLTANAQLNGATNIRTIHAAVSDTARVLSFALASETNLGGTTIVPFTAPPQARFELSAVPLPMLLEPSEISAARVIKIDVEGAEGQVVRGMEPLLDQFRDDVEIVVEVNPKRIAKVGDCLEELFTTMDRHGFHAYRITNDYYACTYPRALKRPATPTRLHGSIDTETDLIFSRVDTNGLSRCFAVLPDSRPGKWCTRTK